MSIKKTLLPIATALTMVMACTNNTATKEIESVAQGYLDAMGNYLIDDAIPYASSQTRENTIPVFNFILANTDTAYINSNRPATITIHNTRMLSDTTARVYYHKSTPIKEIDDSVTVILEDGKWLVNVIINLPPMMRPNNIHIERKAVDPSTIHKIPANSVNKEKIMDKYKSNN